MPTLKDKSRSSAPDPLVLELQERVRALEQRLDELAPKLGTEKAFMKSFGSVTDNEATRDAERLGRAYRRRQPKC
jgi:hypothetical protein